MFKFDIKPRKSTRVEMCPYVWDRGILRAILRFKMVSSSAVIATSIFSWLAGE